MKALATPAPTTLRWEVQASGWPPGSRLVSVGGSLALTLATLVSMGGATLDYTLGTHTWSVPLVLPVLLVVAAIQAVRYARWRSAGWGLSADGVMALRLGGVLRRGVVYATRAERPTAKLLAGLTPESAEALAVALRRGEAPARLPASRGTWQGVFGVLLYAVLATGLAWTTAEYQRRQAAKVQALSATVAPLVQACIQQVEALLQEDYAARVAAEPGLSDEARRARLASRVMLNNAGSGWHSGGGSFGWTIKRSVPTVLPVLGAWHDEIPRLELRLTGSSHGLRIQRYDARGPRNQAFLDALLPELDQAGVDYEVVAVDD